MGARKRGVGAGSAGAQLLRDLGVKLLRDINDAKRRDLEECLLVLEKHWDQIHSWAEYADQSVATTLEMTIEQRIKHG